MIEAEPSSLSENPAADPGILSVRPVNARNVANVATWMQQVNARA